MTQYDAGPGDWSDREWESPDRKQQPQAKRRITLPPWALVVAVVGIAILLCVGLVLIVRAITHRGQPAAVPTTAVAAVQAGTPSATATRPILATKEPTPEVSPTPTIVLPMPPETEVPPTPTDIAPGVQVFVRDTGGKGLNVRASAGTTARVLITVKDGTALTVLEGPEQASGLTWWKVRTPDGQEGWAASQFLSLK